MPLTFRFPAFVQPGLVQQFMDDVMRPFMERSTEYLQYELESITPEGVTGSLRGSFVTEIRGSANNKEFRGNIISTVPYARFVDEGTRPHWTSVANIRVWAEMHNMNPYGLQWHIAQYGTEGQFIFERARQAALPHIQLDWQRTIGALAHKYRGR